MFLITKGLGQSAVTVLSVTSFTTYVLVVCDNDLVLSGDALNPAKYSITGPTTVTITSVSLFDTNVIRINCSEQQTGGTYTLQLPTGVQDIYGNVPNPSSYTFSGLHSAVSVALARSVDERRLDIIFNKAVLEADASDPTKYTISPTVAVTAAKRITDLWYQLTTGPQDTLGNYTVSIGSIRDINGN